MLEPPFDQYAPASKGTSISQAAAPAMPLAACTGYLAVVIDITTCCWLRKRHDVCSRQLHHKVCSGLPVQDIAIVEPRPSSDSNEETEAGTAADFEPRHCVLLRAGGQMSVLDMAQGSSHNPPWEEHFTFATC